MTAKQLAVVILVLAVLRVVIYYFPQIKISNEKVKRVVTEYLDAIVVAGIAALFIIHFLFRTFFIPSGSMIPTLQVKDFIIVNEFVYRFKEPQRGDIIVFKPPPEADAGDKEFIKRVVGLPGDTVAVKEGVVYINDAPLEEPYVYYKPDYDFPAVKVPSDHLFMMGDNRPLSADSHIWGFLPRKNIVGKAFVIVLPPNRIRLLR